MPALHTLDLRQSYSPIDRAVIEALALSEVGGSLHALDLSGRRLGVEAARTLGGGPGLAQLERLGVHDLEPSARAPLEASALGQRLLPTGGLELDPP
jgi:hypothetical protein